MKFGNIVKGLAFVGAVAFASSAIADGFARGSVKDAAPAPFSWSGLYVGAQLGYGWTDSQWTNLNDGTAVTILDVTTAPAQSFSQKGFVGGGHIGLQQQFGQFVLGAEVSVSGGKLNQSHAAALTPPVVGGEDDILRSNVNWITLITGKLGYTVSPNMLAYVKGGFASASVNARIDDNVAPVTGTWGNSRTHTGWTVGAGLDYALTQNWILGVEYNYVDLGGALHSGQGNYIGTPNGFGISTHVDPDALHMVSARLSYKIGREAAAASAPLK